MDATELLPIIAAVIFIAFGIVVSVSNGKSREGAWLIPATLSFLFFIFSIYTMSQEGLLGFWDEHVGTYWENQITFDLLLGVGVAWYLIVPKAKALGMHPLPWLAAVIGTGNIGLLAMLARFLYLQSNRETYD